MFGSGAQKGGLNSSQYDFNGVAVSFSLFRLDPHQALINPLHREQEVMSAQLLAGQFLTEEWTSQTISKRRLNSWKALNISKS